MVDYLHKGHVAYYYFKLFNFKNNCVKLIFSGRNFPIRLCALYKVLRHKNLLKFNKYVKLFLLNLEECI